MKKTIVFGASDDLIEVEGFVSEEVNIYEKQKVIASDGTEAVADYSDGRWYFDIKNRGSLFERIVSGSHDDGQSDYHNDRVICDVCKEVPYYSDVIIFKPGLEWIKVGRIKIPAEKIIDTNTGNENAVPGTLTVPMNNAVEDLKHFGNILEFIELVRECRDAQKRFFKTRERPVLEESKRLEKSVDDLLIKFEQRQSRLF